MYSGTGVCAGHAHWQSTTLWKWSGESVFVGSNRAPRTFAARVALRGASPMLRQRLLQEKRPLRKRLIHVDILQHAASCPRRAPRTAALE
jgi:hypothetical protein